jgi:hypothetical protein
MKILCLIIVSNYVFISHATAQFSDIVSASPKLSQPVCITETRERPDVPDLLTCDGVSYCFKDQSYNGICGRVFCQEKFCENSKSCKNDNEPDTIACYNKMVAASNSKSKFNSAADIPVGVSK